MNSLFKKVEAAKRKLAFEFSSKSSDNIGTNLSKRLEAIKNDRFKNIHYLYL